jgi:hypothetical protein
MAAPLVIDTPEPVFVFSSPTTPAAAELPFVMPFIVGVEIVGDVPNTADPDPVSSDRTPASCALVVAAN